jgi:pimeloyl-ACP methyl ester carboxylesterase
MEFSRRDIGTLLGASFAGMVSQALAQRTDTLSPFLPAAVHHRRVKANGINLHIAEQGTGPLVLLCHGFPESWYSWRNQFAALANAGFQAVAPDMRGYGQSDAPPEVTSYSITDLVGDMVDLVAALGQKQAIIVGHDWGATVAWYAALFRPDVFPAVVALSGPYRQREPAPPLRLLREKGFTLTIGFTTRTWGSQRRNLIVTHEQRFGVGCTSVPATHRVTGRIHIYCNQARACSTTL